MLILEGPNKQATEDINIPKYKARNILTRELYESGKSNEEISEILGVSIRTVQRNLKMFSAVNDSERRLPGNTYKLSNDRLTVINNVIASSPTESGFLVSEWTPHVLIQYIRDEYNISISREKARQLLQSNRSIAPSPPSDTELKKIYKKWKRDTHTEIWTIGHLYLGTQNRQGKYKNGKKPFVDEDLLKTQQEIKRENIDLTRKATPQIALCAMNAKTGDIRCIFLDPNADEKQQINRLFVKAANLSRSKRVIFITTKSSIVGRTLETRRHSLLKKSISLEFFPSASFVFEPLHALRRSILTRFTLFDRKESQGIIVRSTKAKEFGKTTHDILLKHFQEISSF